MSLFHSYKDPPTTGQTAIPASSLKGYFLPLWGLCLQFLAMFRMDLPRDLSLLSICSQLVSPQVRERVVAGVTMEGNWLEDKWALTGYLAHLKVLRICVWVCVHTCTRTHLPSFSKLHHGISIQQQRTETISFCLELLNSFWLVDEILKMDTWCFKV